MSALVHPLFDMVEEQNISRSDYIVSRIVYSKLCADAGSSPDYFDQRHQPGAELPYLGEYGPDRAI